MVQGVQKKVGMETSSPEEEEKVVDMETSKCAGNPSITVT